jgi:hypothetical protein
MLAGSADRLMEDATAELEWDRTLFEQAEPGEFEDPYLGEIK